ncbi:hypothetical protein JA1_002205 [Spathaspora sp. JA1]|nr:hypothetical protein JA1_002205 [Spathaspora sp. JA1]
MLRGPVEELIQTSPEPQPVAEPRQSQENVESDYNQFKTITLPVTSPIQIQDNQEANSTTSVNELHCHTAPIPPIRQSDRFPLLRRVQQLPATQTPPGNSNNSPGFTNSSSSFFDIETSASQETQIPYSDIELSILSPHQPPYEPSNNPPTSADNMRARMERQQRRMGFPHADMFVEYTEERYRRFRPSDSQQNNEAVISGTHPYQSDKYDNNQENKSGFLHMFTSWRKKTPEQQPLDLEPGLEGSSSTTPTHFNIIKHLKPNTSRSIILPSPATITQEPGLIPTPVYTPKAIPINEFPLNFEKQPGEDDIRRNQIINSLDDEVRDLIDGVDNFIVECFQGIWTVLVAIGDFFINLY